MPGLREKYTKYTKKEYYKSLNYKSLLGGYVCSRFPVLSYIWKYNLNWLHGDLIAGITLGLMVVPQGLAYSKLATLPFQYGLYSSFIGPIVYAFLGTSKDCAIGPSSIIALFLAQTINNISSEKYTNIHISFVLCFFSGFWLILLGFFRLGTIFQFVSQTTIKGFSTGASVVVCMGQLPQVLGIKNVDTHEPVYMIAIQIFEHIKQFSYRDFLLGISSVILLYFLMNLKKITESLKVSGRTKVVNSILNTVTMGRNIILLVLMIAITSVIYSINKNVPYTILGNIEKGFPKISFDFVDMSLVKALLAPSFITTLLITLEHFGSAKAFSIQNKYQIDQNQELIALGFSNLIGSFFGSYPVTGAFSRSAVNSQSGVKTPLGGIVTGGIVIVAMLFLTNVFKLIPSSVLAALIFMSLVFKITGYNTIKMFYRIDFGDMLIFVVTYVVTILTDIKTGLIVSIGLSVLVLLIKISKPRWKLLNQSVTDPFVFKEVNIDKFNNKNDQETIPMLPGIIIFKWQDSITFPNCEYFKSKLLSTVYCLSTSQIQATDRAWSDNTQLDLSKKRQKLKLPNIDSDSSLKKRFVDQVYKNDNNATQVNINEKPMPSENKSLPNLKAVILDFDSVSMIDYSGLMMLIEIKKSLMEYSGSNKTNNLNNTQNFQLTFSNVHENVLKTLKFYPELIGNTNINHSNNSIPNSDKKELNVVDFNINTQNSYVFQTTKNALDSTIYNLFV